VILIVKSSLGPNLIIVLNIFCARFTYPIEICLDVPFHEFQLIISKGEYNRSSIKPLTSDDVSSLWNINKEETARI